ncbi:hypothetical protein BJX62DRAFT_199323 [Aspergillus germanicus]
MKGTPESLTNHKPQNPNPTAHPRHNNTDPRKSTIPKKGPNNQSEEPLSPFPWIRYLRVLLAGLARREGKRSTSWSSRGD